LRNLQRGGAFENSVVIIIGDHGNRYDLFRTTDMGRAEERMPLLAISLPKSMEHFRRNLEHNSKILTSWYDLHEFLLDMATGNFENEPKNVCYLFFINSICA